MSADGLRLSAALADFRRARRRADVRAVLAQLAGDEQRLLPYEEVRRRLHAVEGAHRRLEDIELDAIVGSVGRYRDFNREFLPLVDEDADRWVGVKLAMTGLKGVPPIEVYQIGEAYFVKDGNHRVSVAKELGATHIQAYVTPVHSRVPLGPGVDRDELIIASEFADFLQLTHFDVLRPDADLSVTAPGAYPTLAEHISVHRYFMGIDEKRPIALKEAVGHWYDAVYLPVVEAIRHHGLLARFPERTETDLYLFLAEHRARLEDEFGWSIEGPALAEGLAGGGRDLDERSRALADAAQAAADAGERLNLLDAVLLLFTGGAGDEDVQRHGLSLVASEGATAYALSLGSDEHSPVAAQRTALEAASREAGVRSQFAFSSEGAVKAVRQRAAYVDLVVAPLAAFAAEEPARGASSEGARIRPASLRPLLRRCPKPLLLVTAAGSQFRAPLLAYDGGSKSEEALYLTAYLALRQGVSPVVVSVAERGRPAADNLFDASDYLSALGVGARLVGETGAVASAILRVLRKHGCDLLIIGSRRYTPWLEDLTGGVLDGVLAEVSVPVLVA